MRVPVLLVGLLLAGCAGEPGDARDLLTDYQARLSRVLEQAAPAPGPVADLPPWPRPRQRLLQAPGQRIDLLDAVGLLDCDLGVLIGRRNSALGRVLQPAPRLSHELAVLGGLQACLDGMAVDAPQRSGLSTWTAAKAAELPVHLWNAVLGGPAMAAQLGPRDRGVPLDAAALDLRGPVQALRALARFSARVAEMPLGVDPVGAWREDLKVLEQQPAGARLQVALARAVPALERASATLRLRQARRPLCWDGSPTPRAQRLKGVFEALYVPRVQPWLGRVHTGARDWSAAFRALLAAQPAPPPPAVAAWAEAQQALLARWSAALAEHTRVWQEVLGSCGLRPMPPA